MNFINGLSELKCTYRDVEFRFIFHEKKRKGAFPVDCLFRVPQGLYKFSLRVSAELMDDPRHEEYLCEMAWHKYEQLTQVNYKPNMETR